MTLYSLLPAEKNVWLTPNEVADRFRQEFVHIETCKELAKIQGQDYLAKFALLFDQSEPAEETDVFKEMRDSWEGAQVMAVCVEAEDSLSFHTTVRNQYPIDLAFAESCSEQDAEGIANRVAKALGYTLKNDYGV